VQDLDKHIEAILFSSDHPVPVADLVNSLNRALELELDPHVVINHLETLLQKYEEDFFPFKIVHTGGGYRFLTKEAYHASVSSFLNIKSKRRLSTAAMETLAIIAYRQPISKAEIENIRGVNCDYSIQKLLERELIEITGRSESPGKPLLYSTSGGFMDYFGINSVDELPKLREFEEGGDSIGVPTEALEDEVRLGQEETQSGNAEALPGEAGAESFVEDAQPAEEAQTDQDAPLDEEVSDEEAAADQQAADKAHDDETPDDEPAYGEAPDDEPADGEAR
jgi:segregation and condensation protein B